MQLDRLFCIDLDQPTLTGFRKFISSWCYRGERETFLVDPGPLSTIPQLLAELGRLGVERIDYVLLTHIHIDHAGGTGAVLQAFPEARVICHPEGVRHMIEPAKLWQGSRQVLGPLAEVYGEILPVPAANIGYAERIGASGVRSFLTPGHAQHHCCFLFDDLLFGGEVAGVRAEVAEGIYMRPATPPRFFPEVADDSLARMLELRPRYLVFAHYGLVEEAERHLRIGREQLRLWLQGVAATAPLPEAEREAALFAWLQQRDPIYRNIRQLPADLRERERIFLGNTLKGMSDYLQGLEAGERAALAAGAA